MTKRQSTWAGRFLLLVAAFSGSAQERGVNGTAAADSSGRKYGVIIGINRYDDTGIGDLKYAVEDAVSVYQALTTAPAGFEAEHVALLTDDAERGRRPTRNNMLKFLSNFVGLAGAEDTLLVYFAGHGSIQGEKLYLLPSDASVSLVVDTSVAYESVKSMLDQSPAKRKVLLLDACHSAKGRALNTMTRSMGDQLQAASQGMVVLASCGPEEVSHEMPDAGHGAFTYYLLEGLKGGADTNADGLIGAKELSTYTWDKTRVWAVNQGFRQNPWDLSMVSGDIILAKVPIVTEQSPPPTARTQPEPEPPPVPTTVPAEADYQQAVSSLRSQDYASALEQFDAFLQRNGDSERSGNARFWKAKSLQGLGRYNEAVVEYEGFRTKYRTNKYISHAMHEQAICHARLGQTARAVELLQQVVRDHPMTPAADLSKTDLKKLQEN